MPLRKAIRDSEPGEHLGLPSPRNSLDEVQRLLERAVNHENRRELYEMLAGRAGLDLHPRACWLLYRVADRPDATVEEVGAQLHVDPERLREGVDELESAGHDRLRGAGRRPSASR